MKPRRTAAPIPAPAARPAEEQASHHRRVRSAHASEIYEDYLEAIADLIDAGLPARVTDLARRLGVSHVTVVRRVSRMQRERLVRTAPYQPIALTAAGRRRAARIRERHEIVLRFLLAVGVSPEAASCDAEGIEHHVSAVTLAAFERFVAAAPRRAAHS